MCFKPFTKSQLLSVSHGTKMVGQSVAWITILAGRWHYPFLSFSESHLEGTSGPTITTVAASSARLMAVPPHHWLHWHNSKPGAQCCPCWYSVLKCTSLEETWNFQNPADMLMFCATPALSKGFVILTALAEHSKCDLPLESEVFTFHAEVLNHFPSLSILRYLG